MSQLVINSMTCYIEVEIDVGIDGVDNEYSFASWFPDSCRSCCEFIDTSYGDSVRTTQIGQVKSPNNLGVGTFSLRDVSRRGAGDPESYGIRDCGCHIIMPFRR